jgi:hypothetical protein
VNRDRTSIIDTTAGALLVVFGSALAATALFFVIERDVYVAGFARALLFIALPALLAGAAFAAAPSRRRRPFALIALLLVGGVYGGELALSYANWLKWSAVLADSDPRPKVEVLEELRSAGRDAWPIAPPASLARARAGKDSPFDREQLLPLGGISNVESVFCGEGRPFVSYQSDRHGFFNPDSAFDAKPKVMLLGDSYVQGYCVGPEDGIAPRLRERFPGTLNFGMSGNGPLLMLATLREYGAALEPEFVVWSGQLIFAYLPLTADLYGSRRFDAGSSYARQRTLAIVRGLEIPIVDLFPVIAALPDPMVVSRTPRTHYNELGYELVAREIAAAVASRASRDR